MSTIQFNAENKRVISELISKRIPLDKKPDKAVISVNENGCSKSIEIPVIPAESYDVYGRVTSFNTENNTAEYEIRYSDYFEGEYVSVHDNKTITVKTGGTDAPEYFMRYSQAYISKNADGEYVMEFMRPLYEQLTVSVGDIDTDRLTVSYHNEPRIYVYSAEKGRYVKYWGDEYCKLIVDGEVIDITEENLNKYVKNCESVTLIDGDSIWYQDGTINYIKINGYKETE